MYQLFRSLGYIHTLGICHRDIKPQNLLLDPETGVLKLCDFGSAKHLVWGEPNVSYICSRYYRAPELIFGAIDYTTQIGESDGRFAPRFELLAQSQLSGLLRKPVFFGQTDKRGAQRLALECGYGLSRWVSVNHLF